MSSVHDLNQPVVLDLGSGLTKGGYAGTPDPSVVIGTLVGHAKMPRVLPSATSAPDVPASPPASRDKYAQGARAAAAGVFVGDKLRSLCGVLRLEYPMHRGCVRDWGGVEEVWRHVSTELLSVTHGEHPFLVTENALNPRANRERMGEFFFESLNAPSLCVALPAVLALYASGRTSGLVLDVGDTLTTCVPIVHGHVAAHAVQRNELGGRDVSERLSALLRKSGGALFSTSSERQAVRRIKERFCYVAQDARDEERRFVAEGGAAGSLGASAQLPDGNSIALGAERFRAAEMLFRPQLVGSEQHGVAGGAMRCVRAVDMAARATLLRSVLLTVRAHRVLHACELRETRARFLTACTLFTFVNRAAAPCCRALRRACCASCAPRAAPRAARCACTRREIASAPPSPAAPSWRACPPRSARWPCPAASTSSTAPACCTERRCKETRPRTRATRPAARTRRPRRRSRTWRPRRATARRCGSPTARRWPSCRPRRRCACPPRCRPQTGSAPRRCCQSSDARCGAPSWGPA